MRKELTEVEFEQVEEALALLTIEKNFKRNDVKELRLKILELNPKLHALRLKKVRLGMMPVKWWKK